MKKHNTGGLKRKYTKRGLRADKMTDEALMNLVKDEKEFGNHLKSIAEQHSLGRLEIGRHIHFYKKEHGQTYGDQLYQRVADMGGIAIRSAQNYHRLYRMTIEFKDSANLPNLPPSILYELSKLLDKPNGHKAIIEIAESTSQNHYTTSQVASLVRDFLKIKRIKPRKKPDVEEDKNGQLKTDNNFLPSDEEALATVVDVLTKCSSVEFNPKTIGRMADHRQHLQQIANGLLDHIEQILNKEPEQFSMFELSLMNIKGRCEKLLAKNINSSFKRAA